MKKIVDWSKTDHQNFHKKLKEYIALAMVFVVFFTIPYILRWIDPSAAVFDPGILHTIFVVLVAYSVYQFVAWSVLKTIWSAVGDYMKSGLWAHDFKDLDTRTKVFIGLGLYFAIFIILVLLTIAVL